MPVRLDATNALSDTIGAGHGIARDALDAVMERSGDILTELETARTKGTLGFFELPHNQHDVEAIREYAGQVRGKYRNIVVLGIGGSALGSLMLHKALNHGEWNLLSDDERENAPRYFLVDNVDPELLMGVLDVCAPAETLFIVISKSGGTVETVAAFRLVYDLLKATRGDQWTGHVAVVTDPENGWLRECASQFSLPAFNVPPSVGGRFSVLSAVGLLPAALVNIDIAAVLRGAARANELAADHFPTTEKHYEGNWPYVVAALHWLADTEKAKPISVMMPYVQALKEFSDWYAQLWCESIGKETDRTGATRPVGQSVVKTLGATDQHSQLQLFLEGPNDKIHTLLHARSLRRDAPVPDPPLASEAIAYLDGHRFSKVLEAEFQGTRGALTEKHRPNITLTLDGLTPDDVGELIMGYQIATAVAGELYNINAFDQPGVELGKRIAKGILAKGPNA